MHVRYPRIGFWAIPAKSGINTDDVLLMQKLSISEGMACARASKKTDALAARQGTWGMQLSIFRFLSCVFVLAQENKRIAGADIRHSSNNQFHKLTTHISESKMSMNFGHVL